MSGWKRYGLDVQFEDRWQRVGTTWPARVTADVYALRLVRGGMPARVIELDPQAPSEAIDNPARAVAIRTALDEARVPLVLCHEHRRIWRAWNNHHYSAAHPTDWPGGQHIADSRTSHAERREEWRRKNQEQMDLTAWICLRGGSPQCTSTVQLPEGAR